MNNDFAKTFAGKLKQALLLNKKTQADVACYMHVSSATVSDWCNGKKVPRIDKLQVLCAWLNIDMSDILSYNKQKDANFAERLKEQRTAMHLSQAELAEKLNMSAGAIGMYEAGKRFPKLEVMKIIADFFKVNVAYLMGIEPKAKATTADRIKEIMNVTGLKQVDIIEKCQPLCSKYGVKLTKQDLSQYISGKVVPRQWKLSILAEALDVSETWLMGYDVPIGRNTDKAIKVDPRTIALQKAFDDRPEMRVLFSVAESATKEDIERAIKIIEALKGEDDM